ncbi:hypothetical protein MSG28_014630 [Choristoneura fumiferana]|uniref:Uncharacterized protein n=1 Tax=Choristoneura fumiferana TaxID=7141 RepID=A0ACC0JS97_CHOFU|nr:hypothetical protein MSG28_014630 [Choristoneura fumiferana]
MACTQTSRIAAQATWRGQGPGASAARGGVLAQSTSPHSFTQDSQLPKFGYIRILNRLGRNVLGFRPVDMQIQCQTDITREKRETRNMACSQASSSATQATWRGQGPDTSAASSGTIYDTAVLGNGQD